MPVFPSAARSAARAAVLVAFSMAAFAPPASQAADGRVLTVTGEGVAAAAPDAVVVTAATAARDRSAAAAHARAGDAMAQTIAAARAAGAQDRDLATTAVSLRPLYDTSDRRAPVLTGYEGRRVLEATLRDLDALGPLLDAVSALPDAGVDGVRFILSDARAVRDAARDAAVADALATAARMAEAAGVELGAPRSIRLVDGRGGRPMPMAARADSFEAAGVAPGEQKIHAEVVITFDYK